MGAHPDGPAVQVPDAASPATVVRVRLPRPWRWGSRVRGGRAARGPALGLLGPRSATVAVLSLAAASVVVDAQVARGDQPPPVVLEARPAAQELSGPWPGARLSVRRDAALARRGLPVVPDTGATDGAGRSGSGRLVAASGVPATASYLARGVPEIALRAYQAAAAAVAESDPGCGVHWSLLAAIGRVESDHGRFGGSRPGHDGVVVPPIIGIPLDGRPGVARIGDSDGGRLDGDTSFDRAVGPMQFIPGTWRSFGRDGDGDGRADPQNLFDAALSAATYLCAGPGDLRQPDDLRRAVLRYNGSSSYADLVTRLADGYANGSAVLGPAPRLVDPPVVRAVGPRSPVSATVPPVVGPPDPAPQEPGPQSPVPQSPGPKSPGPQDSGPGAPTAPPTTPRTTPPTSDSRPSQPGDEPDGPGTPTDVPTQTPKAPPPCVPPTATPDPTGTPNLTGTPSPTDPPAGDPQPGEPLPPTDPECLPPCPDPPSEDPAGPPTDPAPSKPAPSDAPSDPAPTCAPIAVPSPTTDPEGSASP